MMPDMHTLLRYIVMIILDVLEQLLRRMDKVIRSTNRNNNKMRNRAQQYHYIEQHYCLPNSMRVDENNKVLWHERQFLVCSSQFGCGCRTHEIHLRATCELPCELVCSGANCGMENFELLPDKIVEHILSFLENDKSAFYLVRIEVVSLWFDWKRRASAFMQYTRSTRPKNFKNVVLDICLLVF